MFLECGVRLDTKSDVECKLMYNPMSGLTYNPMSNPMHKAVPARHQSGPHVQPMYNPIVYNSAT